MVEIALLEQLEAFARCGTLSAAAEELHLSQPSVSRSMKRLEDELGVALFVRSRNRLELNEAGRLAAEYAKRILDDEEAMRRRLQAFERGRRSIAVGSCAPGPLMKLLPTLTGLYSGLTVSSEIAPEDEVMEGLLNTKYRIAIFSSMREAPGICCEKYVSERLCLSVPYMHPAASYRDISFREMDGQNFIMYADVGIWEDVVRREMPHASFFKQESMAAVSEIVSSSDLPSFSSSITVDQLPSRRLNRKNIPFRDESAKIMFYIACRDEDRAFFRRLFG
jgi:DNA-binding transcriptional LysR family regulator